MKAAVVPTLGAPLEIREVPVPEPGPGFGLSFDGGTTQKPGLGHAHGHVEDALAPTKPCFSFSDPEPGFSSPHGVAQTPATQQPAASAVSGRLSFSTTNASHSLPSGSRTQVLSCVA